MYGITRDLVVESLITITLSIQVTVEWIITIKSKIESSGEHWLMSWSSQIHALNFCIGARMPACHLSQMVYNTRNTEIRKVNLICFVAL